MPKAIRYAKPKTVDELRQEFGVGKRSVGRSVLTPQVLKTATTLDNLNDPLVAISAVGQPRIDYFPHDWLASVAQKGIAKSNPRLGLQPQSELPAQIFSAEDFLAALLSSTRIDQAAAQAAITFPIRKVRLKRNMESRHGFRLAIVATDVQNDFYDEGYVLRGESAVMGPLKNSSFLLPALPPDYPVPNHFIKIAELDVQAPQGVKDNEVSEIIRERTQAMIGKEVTMSPIQIIEQT